jgi:hypothetical protein
MAANVFVFAASLTLVRAVPRLPHATPGPLVVTRQTAPNLRALGLHYNTVNRVSRIAANAKRLSRRRIAFNVKVYGTMITSAMLAATRGVDSEHLVLHLASLKCQGGCLKSEPILCFIRLLLDV